MPIRISGKDKAEYKRLARNSKNKMNRLVKKFGVDKISDLTSDISIPSIESFTDRKQFNAWKEKQKKFTNRGNMAYQFVENTKGVVLSKKEVSRMSRDISKIQRRIEKEHNRLSNLPFIQGGKQYGSVGNRMGMLRNTSDVTNLSAPMDFNLERFNNRADVKERIDDLHRMADPNYLKERRAQVRENFILSLEKSFNSDSEELVNRIKEIDPDDFYEMFLMYDEIDFKLFDSDGHGKDNSATESTLSRINTYVDRYERDKKADNKLKNF